MEIDKIIDTHLGMNHEDLASEKNTFFIELPKYSEQVEEILSDLIESVKSSKERHNSNALLPTLERIMNYTTDCMGKVYIITGFRNSHSPLVKQIE